MTRFTITVDMEEVPTDFLEKLEKIMETFDECFVHVQRCDEGEECVCMD